MSFLTDLFIKDNYSGNIHRIGDNCHDSLYVDSEGTVHYYNLQNGDGCKDHSAKLQTLKEKYPDRDWGERANEFVCGYSFVPCVKECCNCEHQKDCPFDKLSDSVYEKDNILSLFNSVSDTMKKSLLEIMITITQNPELKKEEWLKELGLIEEKGTE